MVTEVEGIMKVLVIVTLQWYHEYDIVIRLCLFVIQFRQLLALFYSLAPCSPSYSTSTVAWRTVLASEEAKVDNISSHWLRRDAMPVASNLQRANAHSVELTMVLSL